MMRYIVYAVYALLLAASLSLAWLVRDTPLAPAALAGLARVDALSAYVALLTVAGALACEARGAAGPARRLLATLALVAGLWSSLPILFAIAYLVASLADMPPGPAWRSDRRSYARAAALQLLPPLCLLGAAALLGQQAGAWRYDAPAAGAGLTSPVFGLLLLASGSTIAPYYLADRPSPIVHPLLVVASSYPLLRLYSLGPWNLGWLFGTMLLGGALALWAGWRAFSSPPPVRLAPALAQVQPGLALAATGLGSSAGVVAACYALLAALLVQHGLGTAGDQETGDGETGRQRDSVAGEQDSLPSAILRRRSEQVYSLQLWALSGAVPLTAPFVAAWMAVGGAAAGGMRLLAGALWGAALLGALAMARRIAAGAAPPAGPPLLAAALASVALGVLSPAVVQWLILPVAQQLQGGLTPLGDTVLWPWGGLMALDSAKRQVAGMPSAALAGLMLVLGALAWLINRVWARMRDVG